MISSALKKRGAQRSRPPTVLLADDEIVLLGVLERYLRREGFQVLSAPTIEAALELLDHWSISAVVVDLHIGGHDGMALVDAVHRWHRGLSVVILTGDPSGCAAARSRGIPCVQKGEPGSLHELVSVLRALLGF